MKRSELPQQMESLAPLLYDGLGVQVTSQSVLKDRTEVLMQVNYFNRFTLYLDSYMRVPLSSKIHPLLFSFAHIQVKLRVITPIYEIIEGRTMTILCNPKEGK